MKLRNKNTGEVVELKLVQVNDKNLIDHEVNFLNGKELTLKTLADSFGDVKEPLINDEKARKAVRAWAEVNMIDSVIYDKDEDCIYLCGLDKTDLSVRISFDDVDVFEALEHKRSYTIAELCGEEEE